MSAPVLGGPWRERLCALLPDWDSDGAPPISDAALTTIARSSVVPCSTGGVQLEIHQDGFDIEVEVGPDGKIVSGLICVDRPVGVK